MDCVEDEQAFQGPVPTSCCMLHLSWYPMTPSGKPSPFPGFPQLSLLQPSRQLGCSVCLYSVPELEVSGYLSCAWGGLPETRKASLNLPFY